MKKADNTRRTLSSSTRHEVKTLLRGGYSHARFGRVIENFPVELRGIVPEGPALFGMAGFGTHADCPAEHVGLCHAEPNERQRPV
jgi:hypothetical protein